MSQDAESLYWNPITQSNLQSIFVNMQKVGEAPSDGGENITKTDTSFNVVTFFEWPEGTKIHAEAKALYYNVGGDGKFRIFTLATGDFVVGQEAAPINVLVSASACAPSNVNLKVIIDGFTPLSGPANPPSINDTYELSWSVFNSYWFYNKDNGEDQPQTSIVCSCSDGQYDITISYGSPENQSGPIELNSSGSFIDPVNGWNGLWSGTGNASVSLN